MKHAATSSLPLHTLDHAMYPSRGSVESIRTDAIKQLWQALRNSVSRNSRRATISMQPTAAATC